MSLYLALKHLHVGCVVASGVGFVLRGVWMLADSPRRNGFWARRLPHVVDSVLLASAIAMAVLSGQYPFVANWLTAKLFGLLVYIVLGAVALSYGRTYALRAGAFGLALGAYGYIVSVALTRDWRGVFGLLADRLL